MNFYPCRHLPHPSCDLDEFQANRIKLRPGKLCAPKMEFPKRMHKHIGHRVEKEPELIRLKRGTRCPVREEMIFMFLDVKFHVPSTGVYFLIDEPRAGVFQVSHDEPGVRPSVIMLCFENHPKRF